MKTLISIASLFLITAAPAAAQSQDNEVIYKQITEIDMTGVGVSATVEKPSGALVSQPRRPSFNPMIKLRADFDAEMDRSVDEVR
jgi:hypothetical protein